MIRRFSDWNYDLRNHPIAKSPDPLLSVLSRKDFAIFYYFPIPTVSC